MALSESNDSEYARLGLVFDFVIANPSSVAVKDVTLSFWIEEPGWVVFPLSLHESCEEPVCFLGSFSGHLSMTGQAIAFTEFQITNEVTLHGEVSWLEGTSDIGRSKAQVHVSLAEGNQPGALLWAERSGANSSNCGVSVVVDTDTVYAVFGRDLYAVSRLNGDTLWSILADVHMSQPILEDQRFYVIGSRFEDDRRFIRSLNTSNGALDWEHIVADRIVRSPLAVHNSSIFFTSNDPVIDGHSEYSYLTSLDASTGAVNWEYRVGKWISTPPVQFRNEIFFGTYTSGGPNAGEDYLYSIDSISGELVRRYDSVGGHYETPLIANGTAYVSDGYGSIYSMDLTTGTKNWQNFGEGERYRGAELSEGIVFVQVYDVDAGEYYTIQALDAASGSLLWGYSIKVEPLFGEEEWWRYRLKKPTVANRTVYIPSEINVVAVDALSGREIWDGFYGDTCGPLVAANDVLYGKGGDFMIFAIRTQ